MMYFIEVAVSAQVQPLFGVVHPRTLRTDTTFDTTFELCRYFPLFPSVSLGSCALTARRTLHSTAVNWRAVASRDLTPARMIHLRRGSRLRFLGVRSAISEVSRSLFALFATTCIVADMLVLFSMLVGQQGGNKAVRQPLASTSGTIRCSDSVLEVQERSRRNTE